MRFVQFLQVLLLLMLGGYLLLVSLENPGRVKLPLPFTDSELLLPTGWALGTALLMGAAYCAFLLLPPLLSSRVRRAQDARRRREAEEKLQLTLRSRLADAVPAPLSVQPLSSPVVQTQQAQP